MSNAIRYDSLLVRALAAELNSTLAGARLDAVFLERDRLRVTLQTRAWRRDAAAAPSLLWQLHPESGHLGTRGTDAAAGGQVQLGGPCRIVRVAAPADERVVVFELDGAAAPAGAARRIVIELITNQWNAVALGADDRIVAVLRERQTRTRALRAGIAYEAPPPTGRAGAEHGIGLDEWHAALGPVPPAERLRALQRFAAYTSPLNAAWVLGDAAVRADDAALEHAHDRYATLVGSAAGTAILGRADGRWQPYPARTLEAMEPMPSLLDAFVEAASRAEAVPAADDAVERALADIAHRLEHVQRRTDRLRAEQAGAAEEAARLRAAADVLLARLHEVPRGAAHVELPDFEGGTIELELDASLGAADNATRMYDHARRRDRAAARVPKLLAEAERARVRLEERAARLRDGTASPAELTRSELPRGGATSRGSGGRRGTASLPYREYRTSGGLEARVGRGSRSNDDLTFRHSSPNDIWLHARDVAGAHVILRWPHAQSNPPATDLTEAAVLAALHSRARTSSVVAVDWTRRKHVRKPRKAAPGLVLPERVRTIFVEPDVRVEERLRAEDRG